MRYLIPAIALALSGCIIESELSEEDDMGAVPDARIDGQVDDASRPDRGVIPDAGTGGAGGGFGGQGGGTGGAGGEPDAGAGGQGGQGGGQGGQGGGQGGQGGGQGGQGGGEEPTCETECTRLGVCSVLLCDGIDEDSEEAFVLGCLEACAESPAIVALASSQPECEGLVETMSAVNSSYRDVCEGDPDPDPDPEPGNNTEPLGPVNEFGPTARLTFLDTPADAASAVAAGCTVAGAKRGSALGGLLGLLGGQALADQVQPDANGDIQLLAFGRLQGWQAGQSGNEAEGVNFEWLPGVQRQGAFLFQSAGFIDGDPENQAVTRLGVELGNAQIQTVFPGPFQMALPLGDAMMSLPLQSAWIEGELRVGDVGFEMPDGLLQAYLTRDGMATMVGSIYDGCEREMPAELCAQLQGIAPTRRDAVVLLESLIGYDVMLNNGVAEDCDADCNATGVCFILALSGAEVVGVED